MTGRRAGDWDVVIVGAGITGLTAAYAVAQARPDLRMALLERRDALGGNIVTERHDGYLLDGGPDSFLRTKPQGTELVRELGLGSSLIVPRAEARKVHIVHRGKLELMPAGLALAVPTQLGPMLSTALLSAPGKLRMLGDLVLPARRETEDESIATFIGRRFGREAAERLAAPLLGGIYAGDVTELSIQSTFPQLVEVEQKYGSLARGLLALQLARARAAGTTPGGPPESPFSSLAGGMGELVAALGAKLPAGAARCGCEVVRVQRVEGEDRWRIQLAGGEQVATRAVILASPAHVAARLVPDPRLALELGAIPYLSTATVFFAFPRAGLERPLEGSGFVAPKGEARVIAGTWVSSKWEGRAPADHVLVRAFLGGARALVDVATASDDELIAVAREELERLVGKLGVPELTRVFRYLDANPQPIVGHAARLERARRRLAEHPGLYLAGSAYDGVGIPDCIRQGREAARRAIAERC